MMRKTLLIGLFVYAMSVFASGQSGSDSQPSTASSVTPQTQTDAPATAHKKVKHVYTNDDVKAANPNDTPSQSSGTAGDASGATAPGASETGKDDKTKTAKKPAKKASEQEIAAAQSKVDALKKEAAGEAGIVANIQRLIAEQPSRAENMAPGLSQNQSDLSQIQKKLADAQAQLDAMKNPK